MAFWLPHGHAQPWRRLGNTVQDLATLYDGARFFWTVPEYVDERIQSIADLATPELIYDISRLIRGLSRDATITTASIAAINAYGLSAFEFRLEPGDFPTWEASLEAAILARKPVVLPLWTPYYLNVVHKLRALAEPRGILGPANRVVLGARSDVAGRFDAAAVTALRSTGLSVAAVFELDRRGHVEHVLPDDVAADCVTRNSASPSQHAANSRFDVDWSATALADSRGPGRLSDLSPRSEAHCTVSAWPPARVTAITEPGQPRA